MGNKTANTEVDAKEFERTVGMWRAFTSMIKYGTVSILVVLVLMSWFLI